MPTPIAPSNIVSQAEAAGKKLQEIQTSLSESPGVQVINEELPKLKAELDSRKTETARILSARPSLETLRATEQDWQALTKNITAWKKDLKAQIGVFDGQIEELKDQNAVWQKTLDALGKSQDTNSNLQNASANNSEISSNSNAAIQTENITEIPPEVLQRIQSVIASIKETQKQIEEKRGELLTLQTRISEQETRINDTLASIKDVRDKALTNLFIQDSPAIWNVQRRSGFERDFVSGNGKYFDGASRRVERIFPAASRRICSARNNFSRFCRRVILGAAAHAPVCRKRTGTRTRRHDLQIAVCDRVDLDDSFKRLVLSASSASFVFTARSRRADSGRYFASKASGKAAFSDS